MGYRYTRDTPAKARRIYATDEEWSELCARAEAADRSVSAYVVQTALRPKAVHPSSSDRDIVRQLAVLDARLDNLADLGLTPDAPDLALGILLSLEHIAEQVSDIARQIHEGKTRCS